MGKEIERKFLVISNDYRNQSKGKKYIQGYLNSYKERTVRMRIVEDKAFLTIKGEAKSFTRQEFEYEIPVEDAKVMLDEMSEKPLIEKTRYKVTYKGFVWEVDEFHGENEGLVMAEIELESEEQKFEIPAWIGAEVTKDARYYNSNLVKHPFCRWE